MSTHARRTSGSRRTLGRAVARSLHPVLALAWGHLPLAAQGTPSMAAGTFRFQAGTEVAAELGAFSVPQVRSRAETGKLILRFVRFRSTNPTPGPPIVYLSGGPGSAGTAEFRGYSLSLVDSLRAISDVIVFDQRGTGTSEGSDIRCPALTRLPADQETDPSRYVEIYRNAVRACIARARERGIDVAAFTTVESADDVEALRRVLGAEQLTLLGGSYGSHLGLAVIRRYLQRIARAFLAGIEGPDQTFKLPRNADANLERLAAAVRADSTWGGIFLDLLATIRELIERVERTPLTVRLAEDTTVVLGKWDVQSWIVGVIGSEPNMRRLPAALSELTAGNYTRLARNVLRGREPRPFRLMTVATDCASWASPERLARLSSEAATSLLGATMDFPLPDVCEGLDLPRLGAEFRVPLVSSVPVMFVSGELDGRTPPGNAAEVAAGFSNHHLVTVEWGAHSSLGAEATVPLMLAFLRGESVPRLARVSQPAWTFDLQLELRR